MASKIKSVVMFFPKVFGFLGFLDEEKN